MQILCYETTPAKQPKTLEQSEHNIDSITGGTKQQQDDTTVNSATAKGSNKELLTKGADDSLPIQSTNITQSCDTEGGVSEGRRSSDNSRKRRRNSDEGMCYFMWYVITIS